jgi:hypothetical protein
MSNICNLPQLEILPLISQKSNLPHTVIAIRLVILKLEQMYVEMIRGKNGSWFVQIRVDGTVRT